jgi:iron complex outermembrane receptor protein
LQWNGNATFSRNIITDFTEYVDNWDTWEQEAYALGKTDLAYSPNFMFNSRLRWLPAKGIQTEFVSSYVGKQYIDNTSNSDRMLNAWFVNHLIFSYSFKTKYIKNINLNFTVNNLFNAEYESNAWIYSYISEGKRQKMDGYFPQAGRHYYTGIEINF